MKCNLAFHIDFMAAQDAQFASDWHGMGPSGRSNFLLTLRKVEQTRTRHGSSDELRRSHARRAGSASAALSTVTNMEFQREPDPDEWIQSARDQAGADRACRTWHRRLSAFARREGPKCQRLYGGTKPLESLNRKIHEYSEGMTSLDLWDSVRFRIVAGSLKDLAALAQGFDTGFASDIIRRRNYYVTPRSGDLDPYRAIHFELAAEGNDYVEVQLLTAVRDAVGHLDHGIRLEKGLDFVCEEHQVWMTQFLLAANILDAEITLGSEAR